MGNKGFSHERNRMAAEKVWSGAIDDVTEVTPAKWSGGLQE